MPDKPTKLVKKSKVENLHFGQEINLAVKLTKDEIVVEEKKAKINYGGAVSVLIFSLLFFIIMLVNVYYKTELVREKEKLYNEYEPEVLKQYDKIEMIDDISKRVEIYNEKGGSSIEYHSALLYWDTVSKRIATLDDITVTSDYKFSVAGDASSFKQGAIMWNYMSNHDSFESANLKGISKTENGANFQFEGLLNKSYFEKNGR